MLIQDSLADDLPALVENVVCNALAQYLEGLGDVSVNKNSQNADFKRVKQEKIVCWKK